MKRNLIVLAIALLLAGCGATSQPARPALSDQQASAMSQAQALSDKDAFARARKRVAENLKDPDAAKFGSQFLRTSNGLAVCGTVNGKNSFGAYIGMSEFVYIIAADSVRIANNSTDAMIVTAACSKP